jgi:hypothetical protein
MAKFLLVNFAKTDGKDTASELWDKYYESGSFTSPGAELDDYIKPSEGFKTLLSSGQIVDGEQTANLHPVGMDILETETMENSLEIAKSCPILSVGGAVLAHKYQD